MQRRRLTPIIAIVVAVLVIGAPPAHAVSREGTYKGSTSQDRPIKLRVGDDERIHVVRITIEYEDATCLTHVLWDFQLSARIRDDATFHLKLVDDADARNEVVLNGEFTSRRRVKGTFRSTVHRSGGCVDVRASGDWSATKV